MSIPMAAPTPTPLTGKKQKGTVSACLFCKKRKRRCNGEHPCSTCIKHNNADHCEYAADQDRRKWKYDSTVFDFLEIKTDLLEQYAKVLIKQYPEKAKAIGTEDLFPLPPKLSQNQEVMIKVEGMDANPEALEELTSTAWRVREDKKGNTEFYGPLSGRQQVVEEKDEFENLPIIENKDADKGKETSDSGSQQNLQFTDHKQNFNSDTADQQNTGSSAADSSLGGSTTYNYRLSSIDISLISETVREELFNNFVENFAQYFYISMLTINEVRTWQFPSRDPDKQLLLCSVFAYGSIFSRKNRKTELFLQEAEAVLLTACRSHLNEFVLQALLVLSCYELGVARDSFSWVLNAICASQSQFLGLHLGDGQKLNELITGKTANSVVSMAPQKSALFWSIILQDRFITTVLGRGCRIQYFRILSPFYSPRLTDENEEINIAETVFSLHSKLWYIHDRSMSQIYSFKADYIHNSHKLFLLKQCLVSLHSLYTSFPESVVLTPTTTNKTVLLLHLSYYIIQILLHRSYLTSDPTNIMATMINHAIKAAKLIQRFLLVHNFSRSPYFAGYLLFQAAMFELFLLANKSKSLHRESAARMSILIQALSQYKQTWKRGSKDLNVLKALADKWSVTIPLLDKVIMEAKLGRSRHNVSASPTDSSGRTIDEDEFIEFENNYMPYVNTSPQINGDEASVRSPYNQYPQYESQSRQPQQHSGHQQPMQQVLDNIPMNGPTSFQQQNQMDKQFQQQPGYFPPEAFPQMNLPPTFNHSPQQHFQMYQSPPQAPLQQYQYPNNQYQQFSSPEGQYPQHISHQLSPQFSQHGQFQQQAFLEPNPQQQAPFMPFTSIQPNFASPPAFVVSPQSDSSQLGLEAARLPVFPDGFHFDFTPNFPMDQSSSTSTPSDAMYTMSQGGGNAHINPNN